MSEILIGGVDRTSLFDSFRLRITNNKRTYNKVRGTLFSEEFDIVEGQEITAKVDTDLEFGGLLQSVTNVPTTVHNAYTIYATGYEQICDRRTVAAQYTETDAGDIVTDMLALLSGEGITLGNIATGVEVSVSKNAISISELFDELALTSGFVWFIDNDKKLYFQEDYNYTTGTFPTDYEVIEVGRSLVGYSNKVFCVGDNSIVAFAEDTTEQAKMAARFGEGVYGITIRDANADTEAKALAVAEAELKKRAFDKKYVKIKTRERLQEGTIYTNLTIPNTDIVGEDYAIDEVYIEGNGEGFTWTATLQPYDVSILSKTEAWQQKFKQFLNVTNTEITNIGGTSGSITTPIETVTDSTISLLAATTYSETFQFGSIKSVYSMITIDMEIYAASNAVIDILVNQDSVLQYRRDSQIQSGTDTINLTTSLEEVDAGTHTVQVSIISDVAATINDLKIDCQQFVNEVITLTPPSITSAEIDNI